MCKTAFKKFTFSSGIGFFLFNSFVRLFVFLDFRLNLFNLFCCITPPTRTQTDKKKHAVRRRQRKSL